MCYAVICDGPFFVSEDYRNYPEYLRICLCHMFLYSLFNVSFYIVKDQH